MSDELETFRDQLYQAGQPWSRRGVGTVATGIVGLVICQVAPWRMVALGALIVSPLVIMVGWGFLVIGFRQAATLGQGQSDPCADPGRSWAARERTPMPPRSRRCAAS